MMNHKIADFIQNLEKLLEGLPQKEIRGALSYYEEYLTDAAEAGENLDEILEKLGSPEEIASVIRAEISIIKAQRSPGLRNFTGATKSAFSRVTTPLAIILLSIFIAISYSAVIILFIGAFATLVAAVLTALGLAAEAFMIPADFKLEIIGTIGLAIFSAGFFLLLTFGLWRLGKLVIRASSQLIHRTLKKPGKSVPEAEKEQSHKKTGTKKAALACSILLAVGLILFFVSGLPFRYFTIFNSMKPENIVERTLEGDPAEINEISIATAHSMIKLTTNTTDRIVINYEQPDWLDYEMRTSGNKLFFHEKSNGRLPLFKLSSLHESRTELTVSIPKDYTPEFVELESRGGFIFIDEPVQNIRAKTYTGEIYLDLKEFEENCNLKANTENGIIEMRGSQVGKKTEKGTEYYLDKQSGNTIELYSSRGNISID